MSDQISLLIAFIAGWLNRDIYLQIKRGTFWHKSPSIEVQNIPPFVLSDDCESNSITYRAPEVVSDEPEPEKCPTCNGYHLGGCHLAGRGQSGD